MRFSTKNTLCVLFTVSIETIYQLRIAMINLFKQCENNVFISATLIYCLLIIIKRHTQCSMTYFALVYNYDATL